MDKVELQNRLGHSSLDMTRRYVHLSEADGGQSWSVLDDWQEVKGTPQPARGLDDWGGG